MDCTCDTAQPALRQHPLSANCRRCCARSPSQPQLQHSPVAAPAASPPALAGSQPPAPLSPRRAGPSPYSCSPCTAPRTLVSVPGGAGCVRHSGRCRPLPTRAASLPPPLPPPPACLSGCAGGKPPLPLHTLQTGAAAPGALAAAPLSFLPPPLPPGASTRPPLPPSPQEQHQIHFKEHRLVLAGCWGA